MNQKRLSEAEPGENCIITELLHNPSLRRRLMDFGMLPGVAISILHRAPAGSPVGISCRNAVVALRREDCQKIVVRST